MSWYFLFGAFLAPLVRSQFVTPPSNFTTTQGAAGVSVRHKQVPHGICELTPGVKSLSGYIDVAENEHMFFWFFEARDANPKEAPLTVWINGGPGSSSLIGLFEENGPCSINEKGQVYTNPWSWNNVSNMLYIDQPNDVGFSYSVPIPGYLDPSTGNIIELPENECPDYAATTGTCGTWSDPDLEYTANSTQNAAPAVWKALQGFMGAFPEYSRNGVHFTTESYGGHWGPVFSAYFEQQNALNRSGTIPLSLETLAIGNGWFDPLIQYQSFYNFTVSPGNTYDYSPFNETVQEMMYNALYAPGNCVDQIMECARTGLDDVCSTADNFCYLYVELVLDNYANRYENDIRELIGAPFPYHYYQSYLNQQNVLTALGAFTNWSQNSPTVNNAFTTTGDDNRELGTVQDLSTLLKQGVTFTQYTGDADYNDNWLGGQAVAEMIDAPGYQQAGFENITTSDGIVHGQVRQAGSYAFIRVYESGHEVPFYQPLAALAIFNRTIHKMDLATGTIKVNSSYRSTGPPESTYREGNATVQFKTIGKGCTYNTTTNEPNPCSS